MSASPHVRRLISRGLTLVRGRGANSGASAAGTHSTVAAGHRSIKGLDRFDPAIYRAANADLEALALSDEELLGHFLRAGHREFRLFGSTNSTAEYLSMRHLRGLGLEIGAGRRPTTLFGDAHAEYADVEFGELFGGEQVQYLYSLDDEPPAELTGRYDFVISSHALEHADGMIAAVAHMLRFVKPGGLVCLAVPDVGYLHDQYWMPEFDFAHHLAEWVNPGIFDDLHDDLAFSYMRKTRGDHPMSSTEGEDLIDGQVTAKGMQQLAHAEDIKKVRFMTHKHTYNNDGWLCLMVDIKRALNNKFEITESRYGLERHDCNFVLRRLA